MEEGRRMDNNSRATKKQKIDIEKEQQHKIEAIHVYRNKKIVASVPRILFTGFIRLYCKDNSSKIGLKIILLKLYDMNPKNIDVLEVFEKDDSFNEEDIEYFWIKYNESFSNTKQEMKVITQKDVYHIYHNKQIIGSIPKKEFDGYICIDNKNLVLNVKNTSRPSYTFHPDKSGGFTTSDIEFFWKKVNETKEPEMFTIIQNNLLLFSIEKEKMKLNYFCASLENDNEERQIVLEINNKRFDPLFLGKEDFKHLSKQLCDY